MTITLAAVYAPVGIQGGLTGSLFREFAFTLAGAVIVSGVVALTLSPMMGVEAAARRRHASAGSPAGSTGASTACGAATRACCRRRCATGRSCSTLWVIVALLIVPFYMFSQQELAPAEDQGVVFGVVQAAANSTIDQTKLFTEQIHDVYRVVPRDGEHLPDHVPDRRLRRHGDQAVERAHEDDAAAADGVDGAAVEDPRHPRDPADAAAAAGRRRFPGRPGDRLGGRAAAARASSPEQLVQKAFASGMFIFADADLKFDQPQAEVVFDRDKLRSQGVDLSQAGRDLSTLLGGNYVNRFSIQGRSYKVIPQVKRARAADAGSARRRSTSPGSDGKLVPLSTFATLQTTDRAARAEEVPAAERRAHPGRDSAAGAARPGARASSRTRRSKILPQGFTIDYAGESRQLRTEGSKFLGDVPAVGGPDLSRARGAVRELPRSVHHPRRLGAAGALRRAALLVPRLDDAQHLQPGRADHAGRPGVEERHPHRAVREPPAGDRDATSCTRSSRPPARGCARS